MVNATLHCSTRVGRPLRSVAVAGTLLLVLFVVPAVVLAQPAAEDAPDAVIELWDQDWTINADGSIVYHERKHVRFNNERAYGALADPRIAFNADTDNLEIIATRTRLPDGSYRELPDYANVPATPEESAGWPAFASIRERLLVMSGLQPGAVTEIEYRITTKAGTRPFLSADLRIDDQYPVTQRTVRVKSNAKQPVSYVFPGAPAKTGPDWSYTAKDVAAVRPEPQAPPWQACGQRLTFTTGPTGDAWATQRLDRVAKAADTSPQIEQLAADWTKDQPDATGKLRALQEKLAAAFNFVEFPVDWRPATTRPASVMIDCNYGLPDEAAALLLALARVAGLEVAPGLVVDDETWVDATAQDSMVSAFVVLLDDQAWDAHHGRVVRDEHWAGHTVVTVREGKVVRTPLPEWTEPDDSRCQISGKLTIKDDGTLSGELRLRTTGLFVSADDLRCADAQKKRLGALFGRVVPGLKIESFAVMSLADGLLEATAQLKSTKPLEKADGCYLLRLAENGPFMADVPLPLRAGERVGKVRLAGAFDEQIEVTLEWPEKWAVLVQPVGLPNAQGCWGEIEQSAAIDGQMLTLARHTRVGENELCPADFAALRSAVDRLRTESARTLLLKP